MIKALSLLASNPAFVGFLVNLSGEMNSRGPKDSSGRSGVVVIHNIISPYKTLLFRALYKKSNSEFRVIYLAETETRRFWEPDRKALSFPYLILSEGNLQSQNPFALMLRTYQALQDLRPSLVITWGYDHLAYWAALAWAKQHRRKIIVAIESHREGRSRFWFKEKIKKFFVTKCDAALVAGTLQRDYAMGLGIAPQRTFVMKGVGGIDAKSLQVAVGEFKSKREAIKRELKLPQHNLLYVGRLIPEKNLIFLLQVFREFRKEAKNWGLILVGDGPERKRIEDFIRTNRVEAVFLLGYREGRELAKLYAVSDVFVLPSISEAWGLVVEEAMAAGLPILVSRNCGCYSDLVSEGENGFSFDPKNRDALLSRLRNITLGEHDLQRMGQKSSAMIQPYGPEQSAEVIKDAIKVTLQAP